MSGEEIPAEKEFEMNEVVKDSVKQEEKMSDAVEIPRYASIGKAILF